MAEAITIRQLMSSGSHFGHRSSRWNPKMKPYIFMKRNLVHIIDLRETVRSIHIASKFLTHLTSKGGEVLFVGTKRQARSVAIKQARRSGMHYVSERWLGGTLTNFSVIRNRMKRLEYLEELESSQRINMYSKKMRSSILRLKSKMLRNLEGIRKMTRLPNILVIIDPGREKNAVKEARRLGIPTIAIIDTDSNPDLIDLPIPANDDASRSIDLIMGQLGDAVMEGVEKYKAHVGPIPDRAGQPRADDRFARRRTQPREGGRGGLRPVPRGGKGGPGTGKAPAPPPEAPGQGEKPSAPKEKPETPTAEGEKPAPEGEKPAAPSAVPELPEPGAPAVQPPSAEPDKEQPQAPDGSSNP